MLVSRMPDLGLFAQGPRAHAHRLNASFHDRVGRFRTDRSTLARRDSALEIPVRLARFEEQATIGTFDFTANANVPVAALRDRAALRWLDAGQSVIHNSAVGVGKTDIAQALGHNVIRRGDQVRFLKSSRVLADLADGHADRTWARRLREYTRPAVPILDDFAMR